MLVTLICTLCRVEFNRSKKAYNRSKHLGGDNYKPFCSPACSGKFRAKNSLSRAGLDDGYKRCTKCLTVYNECIFGKSVWCKECNKKYQSTFRAKNSLTDEQKKRASERSKKWREGNKERIKEVSHSYYIKNKENLKQIRHDYYENNKDKFKESSAKFYIKNKEEILKRQKELRILNIEGVRKTKNIYEKNRKLSDPSFLLRKRVSSSIRDHLKRHGYSKKGKSIIGYLDYSIDELKRHIENQFEDWMSWDNYGSYKSSTWDDNNSSTWIWNIDHIIPQSKLPYTSMEDDNFKKCWALNNLRPYSAKQNLLDSVR